MISDTYGVMVLKLEFWLSMLIFLGGGALIWHDMSLITPIFTIWGILITFWFKSREAEKTSSNLITALQQQPPSQIPQIPQIPQEPQIPITEKPAEPRAPQYMQPSGDAKNV
jgi:hypothetical protein